MHANAGASGRDHLGGHGKWQVGHAFKEGANLGVLLHLSLVHDRELGRSRHKHGEQVALLVVGVLAVKVFPVVLNDAFDTKAIKQLLRALFRDLSTCDHLCQRLGYAHLHMLGELCLLLGHDGGQTPVFGHVGRELLEAKLDGNAIGNLFALAQHARFERLCGGRARSVGCLWLVVRGRVVFRVVLLDKHAMLATCGVGAGNDVSGGYLLVGKPRPHRVGALLYACSAKGLRGPTASIVGTVSLAHVFLLFSFVLRAQDGSYFFQSFTAARSQLHQASMPSPVLAERGQMVALGLRMRTFFSSSFRSKSK